MQTAIGRLLRSLPYLLHRATRFLGQSPQRGVSPSPETLEGVRKILVIKLDAIGDLLMATPALRAIRRRFPRAQLDLLVQPHVAPLAESLDGLNAVERLPVQFLMRGRGLLAGVLRWAGALFKLRREGYDLAVDLTGLFHTAAAAWATGAPLRLGLRRPLSLGLFTLDSLGHFYTHEFDTEESDHLADRMSIPARALQAEIDGDGWELGANPRALAAADRLLAQKDIRPGGAPLVVVHPAAKWAPKRWAETSFAETIDLLAERGFRAVVVGGPEDGEVLETLRRACRSSPLIL
ncbi:MAG: glycosyltransferase family 9 protein, partial [bacterium]